MFLTHDDLVTHEDFDICIVGAGPAGLTIARHFLESEKKVLLLESGDGPDYDVTGGLNSGVVKDGDGQGGLTYAYPAGSGLELSRYRGFGGTMNVWTGRIRPLDPTDMRKPLPVPGWPFHFEELEKWYDVALQDFGIDGLSDFYEKCSSIEKAYYPLTSDSGLTTKAWLDVRQNIGIEMYDKVEASPNIHCILDATVVNLLTDKKKNGLAVTAVEFKDSTRKRHTVKARRFILAAGGIENPRLLLLARKKSKQAPAANNKWVGACFMEHFVVPVAHAMQPVTGAFQMTTTQPIPDTQFETQASGYIGPKEAALESGRNNGALGFRPPSDECQTIPAKQEVVAEFEQLPNPDSRVTLSDDVVDPLGEPAVVLDWRMTAEDKKAMVETVIEAAKKLYSFGTRFQFIEQAHPDNTHLRWSGFASHHMGTTRISASASEGVVDSNLRVHGTENLYVAGSSVFPSGGVSNPTLTIMAFSYRLAAHLEGLDHV